MKGRINLLGVKLEILIEHVLEGISEVTILSVNIKIQRVLHIQKTYVPFFSLDQCSDELWPPTRCIFRGCQKKGWSK